MLKFKGDPRPTRDAGNELDHDLLKYHGAWKIPLVDEVDDTLSFMYADTVLQILRGQGIYWGWEIDRSFDNGIRDIEHLIGLDARREVNQIRYYEKKRRENVTKAE